MVSIAVENQIFKAIVPNTNSDNSDFVVGQTIHILFKETDVILSTKMPTQISILNQFLVLVKKIKMGEFLSRITVSFENTQITTVVPVAFAKSLSIGTSLTMLIRSNELMLMES